MHLVDDSLWKENLTGWSETYAARPPSFFYASRRGSMEKDLRDWVLRLKATKG